MGHWQSLRSCTTFLSTVIALIICAPLAVLQGNITLAASKALGSGQQATFTDPFAYCAALGTIDAPDSRYA
jgi:hypothetical protein